MPDYHWEPIKDLPEDFIKYSDPDLRLLEEGWQAVRLETAEAKLNRILNEVKREWAIETGKIEGLYTLTKGITETLIKNGINAKLISHSSTNRDPELVAAMLKDQQDVIDGLFDFVAHRRQLSLSYIREMHQTFTRHQETTAGLTPEGKLVEIPLIKGDWKKWPNNPLTPEDTVHEYAPPEQVASEMDRLIELHETHLENSIHSEVEAAFIHHRFTQIHPFQDGNGRVARALASLIFLRNGDFPFVVKDEERAVYIHALEEADRGQLMPLISFVSEKQKDILYKALTEAQNLDIEQTINRIKESSKEYRVNLDRYNDLRDQTSRTLTRWLNITEDILKKYEDSINIENQENNRGAKLFEFISYEAIYKQIDLPDNQRLINEIPNYTIAINSIRKSDLDLRLYLCSIGEADIPMQIFAALEHHMGDRISSISIDAKYDYRLADLNFRDWISTHINAFISENHLKYI